MKRYRLALWAIIVILIVVQQALAAQHRPSVVPVCPEDAVAIGTGDYVGGIGWSSYHCEALDDLGA